jgi:phosphate transport system ATP-binding protein
VTIEVIHESFYGGSVVQLAAGSPDEPDVRVTAVHPATITLSGDRVSAAVGDIEWSWLLLDIEAVFHGGEEAWTLLAVPGIEDHGVAVSKADAARFRGLLDDCLPASTPIHRHPTPVPPPLAPLPPQDDLTLVQPARPVRPAPTQGAQAAPSMPLPGAGPPPSPAAASLPLPAAAGAATILTPRLAGRGSAIPAPSVPQGLAAIEARGIAAWFGARLVLDRVSLAMAAGEVTALIGPSGCGKSTFLRILNRMHELIPSASLAGEVLLDGADIYEPARKVTDARRQIGMVFQKPNPFPAMSIYDNVLASFQLTGTKVRGSTKDDVVESCLRRGGLWEEVRDRLRQPGGSLSGGQQQRLCIARALAIRPRVLLMDEPCSALDPTSTRRIEQTIAELKAEVTIVIVTHNMQQAARVSDQCAFFLAEQNTPGVIVEHGPTDAMFHAPQDPRTSDYVNGRFG